MTHYDDTRDVFGHIHKLELQSGFRGYNHFGAAPSGWRGERDFAERQEESQDKVRSLFGGRFLHDLFGKLRVVGAVRHAQT